MSQQFPGGQPPDEKRLVIGAGDIDHSIPVHGPRHVPSAGGALPSISSVPSAGVGGSNPAWLGNTAITSGLISGLVGGLVGALLREVIGFDHWSSETEGEAKFHFALMIATVGGVIGFVLLAWEGLQARSSERAWRQGIAGALIGAVSGFAAGWIGIEFAINELESLFEKLSSDQFASEAQLLDEANSSFRAIFAVIFGLLGLAVGGGIGLRMSSKKAVNGFIGGGLGGAISGVIAWELWDPFAATGDDSGTFEVILAFTLTGAAIGLGMGLVDRIRRDAWLLVTAGPMSGKEFILFKPDTGIGSDYRADIVLVKDRAVQADHLHLRRDAHGTALAATGSATVVVNGRAVTNHRLSSGDRITVGSSTIDYLERATS